MKRVVIAAVVLTAVAASAPAGAVLTTSGTVVRSAAFTWSEPTTNGYSAGNLWVDQLASETSVDASVAPATDFIAYGYLYAYTGAPCYCFSFVSIPTQAVSPTALSMDPAMNSVRFTSTLTTPAAYSFDLTAVEPGSTFIADPCTNSCTNAWVNPQTNAASVSTVNWAQLYRSGYRLTGTAGGVPLTPSGFATTSTATVLSPAVTVTTP